MSHFFRTKLPGGAGMTAARAGVGVVALVVLAIAGCGAKPDRFEVNRVRAMSLERSRDVPTDAAMRDVGEVIESLFGTPAEPRWPRQWLVGDEARSLISEENLERAAGGVRSDQQNVHRGLYQEHCVICHGVEGDGAGPAARFQSPYPRDFRAGIFKWKSTPRPEKPTREDLRRLLVEGAPGTAMPSFSLVARKDRETLIDYLIYLSVRGETERELLAMAVDELDYGETHPEDDLRLTVRPANYSGEPANDSGVSEDDTEKVDGELTSEGQEVIAEVLGEVVDSWLEASPSEVPSDPIQYQETAGERPDGPRRADGLTDHSGGLADQSGGDPRVDVAIEESIRRGDELFHGQVAGCALCHGPSGAGGRVLLDYDDWTKEFTTRIGITPDDQDAVKPFQRAGALPPRTIQPRHLGEAALRGGDRPESIYRRIHHGIAGTPMPGIDVRTPGDAAGIGLTSDQVWDLVHYLQHLRGQDDRK